MKTYAGFDRNLYPGDEMLAPLHSTFAYAGYWLNAPPGETVSTWQGKRSLMMASGFGFLVLFNGRLDAEIKRISREKGPAALGNADAKLAIEAARREGFPPHTILFLYQEEGGRLLPEQSAYLFAWADGVGSAGFRAGVYCSGIRVVDGGTSISTAEEVARRAGGLPIVLWVANDACPAAPGCVVPPQLPQPSQSGTANALVWQYAQSPRRKPFANACPGYDPADNNCYAPRPANTAAGNTRIFLDLNTSTSPDPSAGREPK